MQPRAFAVLSSPVDFPPPAALPHHASAPSFYLFDSLRYLAPEARVPGVQSAAGDSPIFPPLSYPDSYSAVGLIDPAVGRTVLDDSSTCRWRFQ